MPDPSKQPTEGVAVPGSTGEGTLSRPCPVSCEGSGGLHGHHILSVVLRHTVLPFGATFYTEVRVIQTDLYRVAARFMGTKELAGATHSPQIMAMLHLDANWPSGDEVPWCSAFVNYICWLLDVPRSRSLAARSWLRVGAPVPLEQAEKGRDVVIFSRGNNPEQGHVAFFSELRDEAVFVLGGNQGDAVTITSYPRSRVVGVRRLA